MIANLGKWTTAVLDNIMREAAAITDTGERIDYISRQFLNTPYKESSLTGSISIPQVLTINLEWMDCMTFIEYVEAMRLSGYYAEFTENLRKIIYTNPHLAY